MKRIGEKCEFAPTDARKLRQSTTPPTYIGSLIVSESPQGVTITEQSDRVLTAAEFQLLAEVPPAAEWLATIDNPNARRAYRNDLQDVMTFVGIATAQEFRLVNRTHILVLRQDLERRQHAGGTLRLKLAAPVLHV